ncbi:MAG: N-acetylneuraminate synthase [Oscillospiraceae bacterium]|nr:N-acetylneuraminate synthase [Oscillospiraceae bacterium]
MSVFIIAEAGVNHNGSVELAKKLIDAAAAAKADAVKFQTFIPEKVISQSARKADYQVASTGGGESQLDMVRKLYIPYEGFAALAEYCKQKGILFLSTPFDLPSLDFLCTLGVPYLKIPSGEITNLPLLLAAARKRLPVILSTGMSDLDEIRFARDTLLRNGCPRVALLHCNTEYPTPYADANLRAMLAIRSAFGGVVGYSDHTLGIEAPIAAVALGAEIIEKHFTLDKTMPGPDHSCSLEPDELAAMVTAIRHIEAALGSGEKVPSPSERKNKDIARKSIVAARAIRAGEAFSEENLDVKRPGSGLSPTLWFDVIGRTAKRDFAADELIEL